MTTNNRKQLHERLWAAAEQLRANSGLKLNEISEPILGLIFLKFADVRFKKIQTGIVSERKAIYSATRVRPVTPDDYKSKGVLFLPEIATYSYLMSLPESKNIGKAINEAMKEIEASNTDLAGVLPQDFTSLHKNPGENSKILITLLKNFNQIPDEIEGDAFGEIYEYFLGEFARSEGAKGGEFFTPQSIVKLLVEIIEPYHGKIYDPACGSGGMFVQSANFVKSHSEKKSQIMNEVALYGQEKGTSNIRTAKMNLAIHGLSGKISEVNSFYTDAFNSVGKFDFVLANPPFNVKGKDKNGQIVIDPAKIKGDPRYHLGLPITGKGEISNANYLWMQIFESALNKEGRAGFVMASASSDAGNAEKEIRKKMIEAGLVDVIVSVGTNMFMNAALPCALWFFDKRKTNTERKNKVLFINAQDIFTPIDRAHSEWTEEQIQEIADIVRRYREESGEDKYKDIKGRCKVATLGEIASNHYSLNPLSYISFDRIEIKQLSFKNELVTLKNFLEEQNKIDQKLNLEIITNLKHFYPDVYWNNIQFNSSEVIDQLTSLIFREWFVKFRFPGYEKVKMIDSKTEYGKIPEEWHVNRIGDKIQIKKGKNITRSTVVDGSIPVVAGGLEPAYFHNKPNTQKPVITISASGANAGFIKLYSQDIWASDCSYIDKGATQNIYFYYLLLKDRQEEIYRLQRGSAQPHVYPKDLMDFEMVYPPEIILKEFEQIVTPFFELSSNLKNQKIDLSKTRDLLMPQLVTGKRELK